jgi:hypothetical protein
MHPIGKLNFQHGRSERVEDRMRQFRLRAYHKREVELNGTRVPTCQSIVLRQINTGSTILTPVSPPSNGDKRNIYVLHTHLRPD